MPPDPDSASDASAAPSSLVGLLADSVKYDADATISNGATPAEVVAEYEGCECPCGGTGQGHDPTYPSRGSGDGHDVVSIDEYRRDESTREPAEAVSHGLDGLTADLSGGDADSTGELVASITSQSEGASVYDSGNNAGLGDALSFIQGYDPDATISNGATAAEVVENATAYGCECPNCGPGDSPVSGYSSGSDSSVQSGYAHSNSADANDAYRLPTADSQGGFANSVDAASDFVNNINFLVTDSPVARESAVSSYHGTGDFSDAALQSNREVANAADVIITQYAMNSTGDSRSPSSQSATYSSSVPTFEFSTQTQDNRIDLATLVGSESLSQSPSIIDVATEDSVMRQYAANDNIQVEQTLSASNYQSASSEAVAEKVGFDHSAEQQHIVESTASDSRLDLSAIVSSMDESRGESHSVAIDSGDSVIMQYAANDNFDGEGISHSNYQNVDSDIVAEKISSNYQRGNQQQTQEHAHEDSGIDLSAIVSSMDENRGKTHSAVIGSGDSVLLQYAANDNRESDSKESYATKSSETSERYTKQSSKEVVSSQYRSNRSDLMRDHKQSEALEGVVGKMISKYQPRPSDGTASVYSSDEKVAEIYEGSSSESHSSRDYVSLIDSEEDKRKRKRSKRKSSSSSSKKSDGKKKSSTKVTEKLKKTNDKKKEARKKIETENGGKNDSRNRTTRQKRSKKPSRTRRKRSAA